MAFKGPFQHKPFCDSSQVWWKAFYTFAAEYKSFSSNTIHFKGNFNYLPLLNFVFSGDLS